MIIGIGGASTAGKTTTANKIRNLFAGSKVSIICQDDFVKPVDEIPRIDDRVDWEHPESVDHEKLLLTILAESKNNDLVIAEGLMIFYNPLIKNLFDKKIFITIDEETFKFRKRIDHRWGFEPDWYIAHIWKSYLKYGSIVPSNEFLMLDGTNVPFDLELLNFLKSGAAGK